MLRIWDGEEDMKIWTRWKWSVQRWKTKKIEGYEDVFVPLFTFSFYFLLGLFSIFFSLSISLCFLFFLKVVKRYQVQFYFFVKLLWLRLIEEGSWRLVFPRILACFWFLRIQFLLTQRIASDLAVFLMGLFKNKSNHFLL